MCWDTRNVRNSFALNLMQMTHKSLRLLSMVADLVPLLINEKSTQKNERNRMPHGTWCSSLRYSYLFLDTFCFTQRTQRVVHIIFEYTFVTSQIAPPTTNSDNSFVSKTLKAFLHFESQPFIIYSAPLSNNLNINLMLMWNALNRFAKSAECSIVIIRNIVHNVKSSEFIRPFLTFDLLPYV